MRVACIAALSVVLGAFAPEQGPNTVTCHTQDYVLGSRMNVTFDVNVIGDEYFVMSDVKMNGMYHDEFVQRTVRGNTLVLEKRRDADGEERLTLHNSGNARERLTWIFRDQPLSDAVAFDLPATATAAPLYGRIFGHWPGARSAPPGINETRIATKGYPDYVTFPQNPNEMTLRPVVAGCETEPRR